MALLTPTQSQEIVDSATPKCICIDGTYHEWHFIGRKDGHNYYCNTKSHGDIHSEGAVKDGLLGLDENSTEEQVKTAMQDFFETQIYLGIKPVIG